MVLFNRRKYMKRRSSPQGAPADLADAVVTLSSDTVTYTGNPVYPSITVTYEGATLVVNIDYTLNYSDNTNVGAATVVVTGMGEFTGQVVKTFQIVAASTGSWDFDITKTSNVAAAAAYLIDPAAYYESNKRLDPYTIQVLPDGRLHFVGQAQGHAYIWGFEDGHPFEVEHFKSTFDSKSGVKASAGSQWLSSDGTKGVFSYLSSSCYPFTLSTAFDLTTRSSFGEAIEGISGGQALGMAFSPDGMHFFFKPITSSYIKARSLTVAWNPGQYDSEKSADIGTLSGESSNLAGFCVAPDGKRLVVISKGSVYTRVCVFTMSTPWDVSTLEYLAYKDVYNNIVGTSGYHDAKTLAINEAGTKMIIFDRCGDAQGWRFCEYNLTA